MNMNSPLGRRQIGGVPAAPAAAAAPEICADYSRPATQLQRRAAAAKRPQYAGFPGFATCEAPAWPAKGAAQPKALRWPNRSPNQARNRSPDRNGAPTHRPTTADAHRRCAGAARARGRTAAPDFAAADAFVWHPQGRRLVAGAAGQPRRHVAAQGHRPRARHADGEHRALRQGPAGQQRAAVGRARHGQVVAGQGRRMPRSTPALAQGRHCSS